MSKIICKSVMDQNSHIMQKSLCYFQHKPASLLMVATTLDSIPALTYNCEEWGQQLTFDGETHLHYLAHNLSLDKDIGIH